MSTVRAKFKVVGKKEILYASPGATVAYELSLNTVYDSNPESENGKFFLATPGGNIGLSIVKPEVAGRFQVGAECYVDFTFPDKEGE